MKTIWESNSGWSIRLDSYGDDDFGLRIYNDWDGGNFGVFTSIDREDAIKLAHAIIDATSKPENEIVDIEDLEDA